MGKEWQIMDVSCIKGTSGVNYSRQIVFRICMRGKCMKRLKNGWKRIVAFMLATVVAGSTWDASTLIVSAEEVQREDETGDAGDENVTYEEEVIELPELETSAMPIGMFSLSDGNVTLKDTNEVAWIDRLDLTAEDCSCIREFYNTLIEASDNDGVSDYLIEDAYFKETTENLIEVTTVTGTAATEDEVNDVKNSYISYISAAYQAFDRDCPEVFWLSGKSYIGTSTKKTQMDTGYD